MNPDDTIPDRAKRAHKIASDAAHQLFTQAVEADLDWAEMALCLETSVAIAVGTIVVYESGGQNRQLRMASEIIRTVAEGATRRVTKLVLDTPADELRN
jgi:hypothetical protein